MFDLEQTKALMQGYITLHSLNQQYHALCIEESVFITDKEVMKERKSKVSKQICEVLLRIAELKGVV